MAGEINARLREFLNRSLHDLVGRVLIVGASGSFHLESVLARAPDVKAYSSDDRFLPNMIGWWLLGHPLAVRIAEPQYAWLWDHLPARRGDDDTRVLACLLVLEEMLVHEPRSGLRVSAAETAGRRYHRERMWGEYRRNFAELVKSTCVKLSDVDWRIDGFSQCDVFDHFHALRGEPNAFFCFNEAALTGQQTRSEKRLAEIFGWAGPHSKLGAEQAEALRSLVAEREFLWITGERIPDWSTKARPWLVFQQKPSGKQDLFVYSNRIGRTTYLNAHKIRPLPKIPLADSALEIGFKSRLVVKPIERDDMLALKDAFLAKKVYFGAGDWAFGVFIRSRDAQSGGWCEKLVGGFEYRKDWKGGRWIKTVVLYSFFALPGTRYKRLSKLVVLAALAQETKTLVQRRNEFPVGEVTTTMYTKRDSSMLMRGVMDLARDGFDGQGQKVLVYTSGWGKWSLGEALRRWVQKWSDK